MWIAVWIVSFFMPQGCVRKSIKGNGLVKLNLLTGQNTSVSYGSFKGKAPRLMVFEFGTPDGKPAVQANGFMSMSVWR